MQQIRQSLIAASIVTAMLLSPLFYPQISHAGENLCIYTKGTDTRPKGSTELKLSSIGRFGKYSGDYAFYDHRPEIEYGITDKLTVAGELMIFSHNYSVDDPDLDPMFSTQNLNRTGAGCISDPEASTDCRFNDTQFAGYELGIKYNVLSPYKDWMGLSFGLGFESRDNYRLDGSDIDQKSYTGTVFMQKDWMDDKLVLAINTKMELERRKGPDVLEEEIALDCSMGISYRVKPKNYVGLEVRSQGDFLAPFTPSTQSVDNNLQESDWDLFDDGFKLGSNHQWGLYFGPTYHYAERQWWITTGMLFQIAGGSGSGLAYNRDGKNYDEHESVHIGLTIGYEM